MNNKLIIEYDGKRYETEPELVSVHDGMATIAVKGSVPIYLPVTELKTNTKWCFACGRTDCPDCGRNIYVYCDKFVNKNICRGGNCERKDRGAEPCANCPFCDENGEW